MKVQVFEKENIRRVIIDLSEDDLLVLSNAAAENGGLIVCAEGVQVIIRPPLGARTVAEGK